MDLDITKEERRTFMRNTLEIAADYPLAGVGKGTYVYSYAMYEKVDDWKKLSYAHNDYLQVVAENGFVGGGALVLAGLALFITLVGRWRRQEDSFAKGVGLGAILGVAAILLHGLTDFNLQIPANAVYFVALLALAQLGGYYTRPTRFSDLGEEWERRQNGGGAAGADGHASGVTGRRASLFPGMVKAAAGIVVGAVLLLVTVKDFLGDRYYREYQKSRTEVRSIESGFPGLELMLKNAWRYSKNPEYAKELGRLYSDMARVENQAGRDEGREKFCDAAVEAYGRALRGNPIDAFGYFETGMIYLLSNTPLMTYADRAKEYFRKALELKPADEFLHLHILIVYMSLWDVLEEGEKDFVRDGYGKMVGVDPKFPAKFAEEWKKSFGDVERLEELLPLIR